MTTTDPMSGMKIVDAVRRSDSKDTSVSGRCPYCGHAVGFDPISQVHDAFVNHMLGGARPLSVTAGIRVCSRSECRGVIFFAKNREAQAFFPPEVLDFDATNLPPAVRESMEEAVKCHAAGCYKASAMMLRRSVEAMCDERDAKGATLKQRLEQLRGKVVLSPELFDAIEELRLLGNDAAHVDLRDFDEVGQNEVELGLELVKELLKAVYQVASVLERLRALKAKAQEPNVALPPPPPPAGSGPGPRF